jgi:periplasmic protein TonB
MKRQLAAAAISLSLHAGLFLIGSGWFMSEAVPPSIPRPVTVTMSYRNFSTPAAVTHKEPVTPPDNAGLERPKAPAKLPKKTVQRRAVRLEEKNDASRAQQKQATDAGEATASGDSHGSAASAKESRGTAALVRAAVPLYKVNPPPRYPAAARRRGQQGTVILSVHVDEQGRVSNLWLFESSGHRSLDTAALQAVKDWIFEPGMQGGSTVAMWVNVPVRFELK